MLTRIPKTELEKGMYVEAVECSQTVFGKRRFVLKSDSDFNAILNSPADFVLINTAIGSTGGAAAGVTSGAGKPLTPAEAKSAFGRSTGIVKAELVTMLSDGVLDMEKFSPVIEEITEADDAQFALMHEVSRLRTKDESTFQHSLSVGMLMGRLGDAVGLDKETVELLVLSGLLHDVGKLAIPSKILLKDGPLSPAERKVIRTHPRRGHTILKTYDNIPDLALEICLHHHELLDGTGYPMQLSGSEISLLVRISTVCDVFDALTSSRVYKRGWATVDALNWLFERDSQFDRKLVLRLGGLVDA
ncbi:putative domain HDIG [Hoeflea phototrophica DFL-43]|jgi:putative nucleotidyltransferase with HDIG domain|uniref:Putative domain HDIG n=1 Tax=Hoeflea phototrophica (strain DSM 17068 / NCIMB 14078 / DFL-43) TaxID=411684 RepID=A9DB16_HOEPD|nr:HD-GYP domain-containing protein [Hoeflea phototrophica]EDQ32429.1 putative domain HDIG [Hoeflea phototrophica DFL-43]